MVNEQHNGHFTDVLDRALARLAHEPLAQILADYPDRPSVEVALTRHLGAIASIAANAPYIGLLGTVLGILLTFHDLAQGDQIAASTVMLGLALALKATAAGLLVAIPATLIYNGLVRRVDVLTARWNGLRQAS